MIAVDTNIISYLFINGDYTAFAERLFQYDSDWHVPLLWKSEFRNVLTSHMTFKGMSLDKALQLTKNAESHLAGREHPVDSELVLRLAASSRCTAYDCEFVALANQLSVPLLTTDAALVKKFPKIVMGLRDFLQAEI